MNLWCNDVYINFINAFNYEIEQVVYYNFKIIITVF